MSKIQLKKELLGMEKEQLIELILEAYSARKEMKEYFEFFINPDVDKLFEKYKINISKEFNRVRRGGISKARISYIKSQLKEFAGFQPGFKVQINLMLFTLAYAMASESQLHFPDTLIRGISTLMKQIIDFADVNFQVDDTVARIRKILSDPLLGSRYFRRFLTDSLESYLASAPARLPRSSN